jgi:hypothetical protein
MLLQTTNITKSNLPILPQYIKDGQNGLCYAYILGKCQGRICGKYPAGHAPVTGIMEAFAMELSQLLTAGIE